MLALLAAAVLAQPLNLNSPVSTGKPPSAVVLSILPNAPAAAAQCTGSLSGVTVTRAGAKTCMRSDGTVVKLANDTAAVEADGLLRENAVTNLIVRTEEFDSASWGKTNVTVPTTNATAPDGSATADLIRVTSTALGQLFQSISGAATVDHTMSVWVKQGAQGTKASIGIQIDGAAIPLASCVNITLTSSWVRYTAYRSGSATGSFSPKVFPQWDCNQSGASANANDEVYFWGAQLQAGSQATSYIPAQGTQVTSVADLISVAQPAGANNTQGCASALVKAKVITGTPRIFGFGATSRIAFNATTQAGIHDSTNAVAGTLASTAIGRALTVIGTWSGSTLTVKESGQAAGSGTYDGTILNNPIYLGSDSAGTNGLTGHLRAIKIAKTANGCGS